jgi:hypothetical protein
VGGKYGYYEPDIDQPVTDANKVLRNLCFAFEVATPEGVAQRPSVWDFEQPHGGTEGRVSRCRMPEYLLVSVLKYVDGKMMIVDGIERKERTESHVYVEYIVSRDA